MREKVRLCAILLDEFCACIKNLWKLLWTGRTSAIMEPSPVGNILKEA